MATQGLAALDIPPAARENRAGADAAGRPVNPNANPGAGLAVRRLTLSDFRCYHHQRIDIDTRGAGVVVLTGDNGAGKTNVLEALSFLAPGRGLRRARLADIIRREGENEGEGQGENEKSVSHQTPWGVAATVATPSGPVDIGTGFQAGVSGARDKRVVRIDGETVKSQAALGDYISVLWLTPQMDRLFLEGAGSRRRFLDRLVFDSDPAHLGRENVRFEGVKGGAELRSLVQNSQFVVVPSEWYDNSPLVIYESFAYGKPVIGARMGGITELIDHDQNGLHFEAGNVDELTDQISYLSNRPDLISEFGQQARRKAENEFEQETHYDRIYKWYEELATPSSLLTVEHS